MQGEERDRDRGEGAARRRTRGISSVKGDVVIVIIVVNFLPRDINPNSRVGLIAEEEWQHLLFNRATIVGQFVIAAVRSNKVSFGRAKNKAEGSRTQRWRP